MVRLLISIVNYNTYPDTLEIINYIFNELDTTGFDISFFITDNSSDKSGQEDFFLKLGDIVTFEYLSDEKLTCKRGNFLFDSENNGFGAANNIVFDYAVRSGDFHAVWILNNDIELDRDALTSMHEHLSTSTCGILGSAILSIKDRRRILSLGTRNMNSFKGYDSVPESLIDLDEIQVDAVSGTSMFVKNTVFERYRFDEMMFMYVEENDLCYRAKLDGICSCIVPSSKVYHYSGKTFGKNQELRWYYKVRNLLYFKQKNKRLNIVLVLYLILSTIKNNGLRRSYLKAYYFGVVDFLNKRMYKTKRKFL